MLAFLERVGFLVKDGCFEGCFDNCLDGFLDNCLDSCFDNCLDGFLDNCLDNCFEDLKASRSGWFRLRSSTGNVDCLTKAGAAAGIAGGATTAFGAGHCSDIFFPVLFFVLEIFFFSLGGFFGNFIFFLLADCSCVGFLAFFAIFFPIFSTPLPLYLTMGNINLIRNLFFKKCKILGISKHSRDIQLSKITFHILTYPLSSLTIHSCG